MAERYEYDCATRAGRMVPLTAAEEADRAADAARATTERATEEQERTKLRQDAAGLRAYLGLAAPTGAQRLAMEKALIRTLGRLVAEVRETA